MREQIVLFGVSRYTQMLNVYGIGRFITMNGTVRGTQHPVGLSPAGNCGSHQLGRYAVTITG
jgi:hypothetical protein